MPRAAVTRMVRTWLAQHDVVLVSIATDGPIGRQLQALVAKSFSVSQEAARTRLLKLNILNSNPTPALFDR